jgi:hypothetical protein
LGRCGRYVASPAPSPSRLARHRIHGCATNRNISFPMRLAHSRAERTRVSVVALTCYSPASALVARTKFPSSLFQCFRASPRQRSGRWSNPRQCRRSSSAHDIHWRRQEHRSGRRGLTIMERGTDQNRDLLGTCPLSYPFHGRHRDADEISVEKGVRSSVARVLLTCGDHYRSSGNTCIQEVAEAVAESARRMEVEDDVSL